MKRVPRTFIYALETFGSISHLIVPQRYNFIMPVHYYCTNEFCLAIKWDHIVIIIIGSVSLFFSYPFLVISNKMKEIFFNICTLFSHFRPCTTEAIFRRVPRIDQSIRSWACKIPLLLLLFVLFLKSMEKMSFLLP